MSPYLLLGRAELIKWRRNWASALAIIAPVTQALFFFIFYWFLEDRADPTGGSGFVAWYQVNGNGWNYFFMPITVALVAAISWDTEDTARAMKHLFAQPHPRYAHYLVKLGSHTALLVLAQVIFFALISLEGVILRRYVPTLHMGPAHLPVLGLLFGTSILATLPLVALQTWVSSRYPGLLSGMMLSVGGAWVTAQFSESLFWTLASPWGLAARSGAISLGAQAMPWSLIFASAFYTGLFSVLGTLAFHWRKEAFTQR
jgi:hypothetical protein